MEYSNVSEKINKAIFDFKEKYAQQNIETNDYFEGNKNLFDPLSDGYDIHCAIFRGDLLNLFKEIILIAELPLSLQPAKVASEFSSTNYLIALNTRSKHCACISFNNPYFQVNVNTFSYAYAENKADLSMKHKYKAPIERLLFDIVHITEEITQSDYVNLFVAHTALTEKTMVLSEQVSFLSKQVENLTKQLSEKNTTPCKEPDMPPIEQPRNNSPQYGVDFFDRLAKAESFLYGGCWGIG